MRSRHLFRPSLLSSFVPLVSLVSLAAFGCSSGSSSSGTPTEQQNRVTGQSDFVSAPLPGQVSAGVSVSNAAGSATVSAPAAGATASTSASTSSTRTIEETDLYRVDGNHLYYLNSYRGLMVFDVTNIDQPKLVGRHAIFGTPIDMVVNNGIAVVIVSDYYGVDAGGGPFYGSIVRGLDATDPTNIKTVGEAQLGGSVVDSRVVGNVLYTVSQNDSFSYGWWSPTTSVSQSTTQIVVNSVNFAGGAIKPVGQATFPGFSGVFNVTENSIMLAHDTSANGNDTNVSELQYIDISDPGGKIALKGKMTVPGDVEGWGTDDGRWNLDFADQTYAHVLTQGEDGSYELSTVDFSNPSTPVLDSTLSIDANTWSPSARFVTGRMYLSPDSSYWNGAQGTTPIQIFDLTNPKSPSLAGSTNVTGQIYNFTPNGNQLFALGNTYAADGTASDTMSLHYLDVTDPTKPTEIGVSQFGSGWSWSPAADTFKAFTLDTTDGLVVLPFSGWSYDSDTYNNGLQLIEFTPTSITTKGAAKTKGWVERGIFVNGRLLSLSDQALAVIDYSNHASPQIVSQLTLARNVVDAQPDGTTLAELSSDWFGYDTTSTQMRVLPLANATESSDTSTVPTANIGGADARVFRNGNLAYVVTDVTISVACSTTNGVSGGGGIAVPVAPGGSTGGSTGSTGCTADTTQMQVVDLSNGNAVLRGKITLPVQGSWSSDGYYWYDWYNGADAVQVGGDALAFRRWNATYTADGRWTADQTLYIVDASNADAPAISSTLITPDPNSWWGNMQVVGDTLYTSHYEWNDWIGSTGQNTVRYYLDQIDLSDRAHPSIGRKINVPGLLVGASATDPTLLYTIDYRWDGSNPKNDLDVVKIDDNHAFLQSTTPIDGWVGNVYVEGTKAYTTVTHYDWDTSPFNGPMSTLHQIDLTNPNAPSDQVASTQSGWGWLLGVVGDRAIVSSGWGDGNNVDVYKLTDAAPLYDQTIRTLGWDTENISRQGNTLFIASGYWGTQAVQLTE